MPVARVRSAYAALDVLFHELAKFGVVGALNYALDVGLFNLLIVTALGDHPLTAKTLSTVVAGTSSYVMNRHWTFKHRARTGAAREYPLYVVISAVGLGITLGCLAISEYALGLDGFVARNISGNVIGVGLAMVFRFWAFKRWVFLNPEETEERHEHEAAEAAVRTTV